MAVPRAWFSQNYRYIVFSILTAVLLFVSAHTLFIHRDPQGRFHHFQHGPFPHHRPPPHGRRPFRGLPGPPPPPPPGGFLEDRLALQEKLYQDSVRERQEWIRQFGPSPEGTESSDAHSGSSFNALWEFFTASFQCPHRLQRIGRLGDSPKWVCGFEHLERKKECVVYSIGVSPESSFEASVLARARGCQVFAYDLTVESLGNEISSSPDFSKRAFLTASSIGKRSDENDTGVFTLSSLMQRNGHSFIDILKIDLKDGQLEALEAFFDDNDFPRLASARAPHPPRRNSRRFPNFAPFLPIGQLQVALSSHAEVYGGIEAFSAWWQKLEKMGLRPFWAVPRVSAEGESLGMIDYSFINIRGDHELISDRRRPPPPPPGHHHPPPPPPPGSEPESHMHWYHESPQRGSRLQEMDRHEHNRYNKGPSEKRFGEWELFAQRPGDHRRPDDREFEGHHEFPHGHEFEGRPPFPRPGKFEDRPEFPFPPSPPPHGFEGHGKFPYPPPPPHEFGGRPEFPHPPPHEFGDRPNFPYPPPPPHKGYGEFPSPPPPPHKFEGHPEFPQPHEFEDRPEFPHPHGSDEDHPEGHPEMKGPAHPHSKPEEPKPEEESRLPEPEFESDMPKPKPNSRPGPKPPRPASESESELMGQPERKWRPMRGSSKARLGPEFWDKKAPQAKSDSESVPESTAETDTIGLASDPDAAALLESFDAEDSTN